MDPASAFGLAINAIALVDFVGKLVGKGYRIYHDANAAFGGVEELTEMAQNLEDLAKSAEAKPVGTEPLVDVGPPVIVLPFVLRSACSSEVVDFAAT